jgi:hypothetical protein
MLSVPIWLLLISRDRSAAFFVGRAIRELICFVRRREFIVLVGGVAVSPAAVFAQLATKRRSSLYFRDIRHF